MLGSTVNSVKAASSSFDSTRERFPSALKARHYTSCKNTVAFTLDRRQPRSSRRELPCPRATCSEVAFHARLVKAKWKRTEPGSRVELAGGSAERSPDRVAFYNAAFRERFNVVRGTTSAHFRCTCTRNPVLRTCTPDAGGIVLDTLGRFVVISLRNAATAALRWKELRGH